MPLYQVLEKSYLKGRMYNRGEVVNITFPKDTRIGKNLELYDDKKVVEQEEASEVFSTSIPLNDEPKEAEAIPSDMTTAEAAKQIAAITEPDDLVPFILSDKKGIVDAAQKRDKELRSS